MTKSINRTYDSIQKQILNAAHYFELLGVTRESTANELTLARRELMRYVHPDINSAKNAHDLSALVNKAYETLFTSSELYILTLRKKPCGGCGGRGVTVKQQGFKATKRTRCKVCMGAGVV